MATNLIVPPPSYAVSTWTVDDVRAAIDEHESGSFELSAALIGAMGRDQRIFPTLRTRINALVARNGGLPFSIEKASKGDGRRAETIAKTIEDSWWDLFPESSLGPMLAMLIMAGVAPGQMVRAKDEDGAWYDYVEPLPLHPLRWDEAKRTWFYRTNDGQQLEVTPGEGGWVLFQADQHTPWMCGAVRALGLPWMFTTFTERDWARYSERHGLPIIAITEPPVSDKAQRTNFYQGLRQMGSTGFLRLPTDSKGVGYGAAMLEPKDRSWEGFKGFLEHLQRGVTITLLGQDGTTQQSSSSGYAQAKVMNGVRVDYLGADAELVSTQSREQVLKPWGRFYVSGWKDNLAGWPTWQTEEPEDLKAKAETLKAFGDALTVLVAQNVPVDVEALAEDFGVPTRAGARFPEPEAPDPKEAEARAAALQGGQQAPPGQPAPKALPGQPAPKQLPPAPTALHMLASGRTPSPGVLDGQAYVDRAVARGRARAQRVLDPDLRAVLAAVTGASTYEEVEATLLATFGEMSDAELAHLVEKALILADLAGRHAVLQDL